MVDVPDIAAFKAEGFKGGETWLCTGKIRRVRPCYVPAFEFLAKNVPAEDVKYIKMTMVRCPYAKANLGRPRMVPSPSRRLCLLQGRVRQRIGILRRHRESVPRGDRRLVQGRMQERPNR
jgi:hypothetical protein